MQGVSIKEGTDVVVHGHKKMPYALMYMMLSRAEKKENVFLENFDPEQFRTDPNALKEDAKLNDRSIVPNYEEIHFDFFALNVRSLPKHFDDLIIDMFAQKSDHICIRVRPRFFDQVGHETMYVSSGNKHFFTKSCHRQTYQNMNRADKNWAQF